MAGPSNHGTAALAGTSANDASAALADTSVDDTSAVAGASFSAMSALAGPPSADESPSGSPYELCGADMYDDNEDVVPDTVRKELLFKQIDPVMTVPAFRQDLLKARLHNMRQKRERSSKVLQQALRPASSIIVSGPRHVGKSTLINEVRTLAFELGLYSVLPVPKPV